MLLMCSTWAVSRTQLGIFLPTVACVNATIMHICMMVPLHVHVHVFSVCVRMHAVVHMSILL